MGYGYSGTCRKCGGTMIGPRYVRNAERGTEALLYSCTTCGFDEHRPTKDAKAPGLIDEAMRRAAEKAA